MLTSFSLKYLPYFISNLNHQSECYQMDKTCSTNISLIQNKNHLTTNDQLLWFKYGYR